MPITVAIIGAGPLGRWLAFTAARAGFSVFLEDVMPTNLRHAQEAIRQELGRALLDRYFGEPFHGAAEMPVHQGTAGACTRGQGDVAFVSTIEDAVREADLVIDCVPDELESKLEILWLLDRMAPPRTVLATPTTQLSITDLAGCTYRPGKCIAIVAEASSLDRFQAAEINLRTTAQTTAETIALIATFWEQLGFVPRFSAEPTRSS